MVIVSYGKICAPFLSLRVIKQLNKTEKNLFLNYRLFRYKNSSKTEKIHKIELKKFSSQVTLS